MNAALLRLKPLYRPVKRFLDDRAAHIAKRCGTTAEPNDNGGE